MGTAVSDSLYGFGQARSLAERYYVTGVDRPQSNDLLGFFAPYAEENLKKQEDAFIKLLYTLDPTNQYYQFNADDPVLVFGIQSSISRLEIIKTAAHTIADQAKNYYSLLESDAFENKNYSAKGAIFGLWEEALVNVFDVERNPHNQERAMEIIQSLQPYIQDLLKGEKEPQSGGGWFRNSKKIDKEEPQSKGLEFLTEKEKELRESPLGSFVWDFYQRYNSTPGNPRYLKERCDDAYKKVYGKRLYSITKDTNQTIAYMCRGIASTIVSKIQSGEKMPPISQDLRRVFQRICEENIRRDFNAIKTHTLKSCDDVVALLLKGLDRIDDERSPSDTLQEQRRQRFEDAQRIAQLVLNSLPQIAQQQGIDLSKKSTSQPSVLNMQTLIGSVQELGSLIGHLAKDSQASPSDDSLDVIRQGLISFQDSGANRA